jgi:hypothetical protein
MSDLPLCKIESYGLAKLFQGLWLSKNPNYPRVTLRANPGLELANALGVFPTDFNGVKPWGDEWKWKI